MEGSAALYWETFRITIFCGDLNPCQLVRDEIASTFDELSGHIALFLTT